MPILNTTERPVEARNYLCALHVDDVLIRGAIPCADGPTR
jgi:hypothetical protein